MTAIIFGGTALAVTATICWAGLRAWRGWLELRRYELESDRAGREAREPTTGARIEMADIKERLRKLEAIATGVDL